MITTAGEPKRGQLTPGQAKPLTLLDPALTPKRPPRSGSGRATDGATSDEPGDSAPAGAMARLEAFLTATYTTSPDPNGSGLAGWRRLIKETAVALRAERAAVLTTTTTGGYRGLAAHGLTPPQAGRFRRMQFGQPETPAPDATEVPCRAGPGALWETGARDGQARSGVCHRGLALARPGHEPYGWLLLEFESAHPPPEGEEEQMLTRVVCERLTRALQDRLRRIHQGRAVSAAGVARERRLLRGLLEAGASIHEALNLEQVLQRIAEILAQAAGFEAVAIYILEAGAQTLLPAAIVGVSADEMARMRSMPIAFKDFAPLMRPDMRLGRSYLFDHRRHQLPPDSVLNTALAVPEMPPDWRPGQWHPLDSLTIPLELTKGELLGLISLDRPQSRRYPSRDSVRALELFADQCAAAISRAQIYQYMEELALTDSLTGLHNRHALEQTLAQDLARIARHPAPYAVLFCDLDRLKEVNDSRGHSVGDQALQQVAAALRQRLRRGDFAARWGGDEFVVLLPDTPIEQAQAVADELLRRIADRSAAVPITASIGVACPPSGELDARSVLEQADAAMYLAKRAGRNRVAAVDPVPR